MNKYFSKIVTHPQTHILPSKINTQKKVHLSQTLKDQEKILKGGKDSWFPSKTMGTRSQCDDIYKMFKAKDCQPRIFYSAKISLNEGKMKTFLKYTKTERINGQKAHPIRNAKENSSGWNERTLDNTKNKNKNPNQPSP